MRGLGMGRRDRVVLLDKLRGLCLILMIFYHAAYDVVFIFDVNFPIFFSPLFNALQLFIACGFILLSGISSRYSHSNLKRGVIVLGIAAAMTLITFFTIPSQIVVFGVLHMLGICMILHGLIFRSEFVTYPPFPGFIACLALFALTWGISDGYIGVFSFKLINLPSALYGYYLLSPIGLLSANFYSSDYFPMLPWMFLFFSGSFLGIAFRQRLMPDFFYRGRSGFLGKLGKRSLIIYILHQPLLYGILTLIFMALGYFGIYQA